MSSPRWVHGIVVLFGLLFGACAVSTIDEPAAGDVQIEPAARASTLEPGADVAADPRVTVGEGTTTGSGWGTPAICAAHCAGGQCFACGLSCQN